MTHVAGRSAGQQLVTVSIPVFNEEANIDRLMRRLQAVADQNSTYDFEFLFTDNASTDNTFAMLAEWAQRDGRVRVLRFSRNFGFQQSILTNLLNSRGSAAIQLDADLQDPPELISTFLAKWKEGYKVVYGVRRQRRENVFMRAVRKLHYRLVSALSEADVPLDAGDFRLVDRDIIEHLRSFQDRAPYVRGAIASVGFPQIGIAYDRAERLAGESKFNFARLIALSLDGICSQSTRPLQYITMFGLAVSFGTALLILAYLMIYLFATDDLPRGFTTLLLLMLASIGINSAFVGLLGEYVGRIYKTVRAAPIAIIADRIDNVGDVPAAERKMRSRDDSGEAIAVKEPRTPSAIDTAERLAVKP